MANRFSAIGRALSGRAASVALAAFAILAGAATYAWLAGLVPGPLQTGGWITGLLVADLVVAVTLVAVLAVRLTQLWLDRRRGAAGSRLHMRLVLVCSVFTITPTVIVTVILSLLMTNLIDFVVKPSQASYEAARAIGEPVRRARLIIMSSMIPPPTHAIAESTWMNFMVVYRSNTQGTPDFGRAILRKL